MITRRVLLQSSLLLPFASPWLTTIAGAQSREKADERWLETIARQLRNELGLPAVWLAAATDDNVEAVAVGVRKAGDEMPATVGDLLTVASVSKPMVGLWIATLVEKSKLTYNSKVLDILPELSPSCLPEHRDITLGQLLTHTAGLARDVLQLPSDVPLEKYPDERIRQAKFLLAAPSPPDSQGKELYSNNGLALAVSMAERVAGEPYEIAAGRFYREQLGLKSWGVWGNDAPDDLSVPWPHAMKDGVAIAREPRSLAFQFTRPSGSAHCTIADAARFGLMATDAMDSTNAILKQSTWDKILAPVPNSDNTLESWYISQSKTSYDHSGSLGTTRSNLMVIPSWRVAVAVHTNADSPEFSKRATDLVLDAIRVRYAQVGPPPPCRITILGINSMDSSWENVIVPKTTDDKLRVRVNFQVETESRTGDLKTTVQVGSTQSTDNRFNGLIAGEHHLHFLFDTPKNKVSPAIIIIDALGTAGNITPEAAHFESVLTLEP